MRARADTHSQDGFTLLEVMIAVVILAVGLSALFTSEAGAIKIAARARTTTVASLLARCKMAEVEETVAKEGWPGDIIEGRDECCEDGEQDGYACEWKVERIKLPDTEEDEDEGGENDSDSEDAKDKPTGMIDQLAELSKQGEGERLSGITDMLGGAKAGERDGKSSADAEEEASQLDPMASMVMGLAFPMLKPVIEEGVRRASVVVKWKQGDKEQTFEVVQFLVSEAQIIIPEAEDDGTGAAGGTGGTGASGGTGTSGGTGASGASGGTSSPSPGLFNSSGRGSK